MLARLLTFTALALAIHAEDWPQWRGPRLDGRAAGSFPVRWSATENVTWRTEIPGKGHASPIVVGERVFVVTAIPEEEARVLMCLDRSTGKPAWRQTVVTAPMERVHRENSHASSTPASDGERVFCAFMDREQPVVAAYDFAGRQLWVKRPGAFSSMHGFCSTPVIYKDKVIVNCDHDGDGYVVAFDRATGSERWRIQRPNKTRSYCAPLIREAAGRMQMVLAGTKCFTSYDPEDGQPIWHYDGPTEQFVASPVFSERTGNFYLTAGFPTYHTLALPAASTGTVPEERLAWHHRNKKGAAYVPSPIIEGDWLLLNDDLGFAHAFDARNGDVVWTARFGHTHASLVSAGGLVYFLNDDGICRVVKPAAKFEIVATNTIGESTYASPALSDGQIFLRSERALWCIGRRGGD
jgi:outer membrane protein assembly factor BamB